MKITMTPIDKVLPYPGNPRVISEPAISKVAASLKEYGFRQPIVVDEAGVIIVGHTRLAGAQRLGLKMVPVHVAEGLTKHQITAYRIADNRTGEEAAWDYDLLANELGSVDASMEQLQSLTGFDAGELKRIIDAPSDDAGPDDFSSFGEDTATSHQCPKCGYEWNGSSKGDVSPVDDVT